MNKFLLLGVYLVVNINDCITKNLYSITNETLNKEWESFKEMYNKSYKSNTIEKERKQIFQNNLIMIENHNKNYTNGAVTFGMGINQFGDKTFEEFVKLFSYRESTAVTNNSHAVDKENFDGDYDINQIPKSCKWDMPGEVNIVKDQGSCRSGYAYSMADALAARYFVLNKCKNTTLSLSAQYLIDCSYGIGNHICQSGEPNKACYLVQKNHGIPEKMSYKHQCDVNNDPNRVPFNIKQSPVVSLTDDISAGNLRKSIWKHGPVSGSICVQHRNFQFAKEGIYSEDDCEKIPTQDVLVVGYGIMNGLNYWIVKNSFGLSWGDKGFLKISAKESKKGCKLLIKYAYPKFSLMRQMDFQVDNCTCK